MGNKENKGTIVELCDMKIFLCLFVFIVCFGFYLYTLCPSISPGDSGEFCASSVILALPHSPGYPLYCLIGKIFTIIIPFGSYAYRINCLSAVFGALTVSVLGYVMMKISRCLLLSLSCLLLAFSSIFWHSSIQAEVFTLNAFFVVVFLLIIMNFTRVNVTRDTSAGHLPKYYLAAFLFGLGLGNHQTLIFLFPSFLYIIWAGKFGRPNLQIRFGIILSLFFLLGLSVYLYLPVRSLKNPQLDWGNPENLHNLWRVFTRADYGSLSLTVGEKLETSYVTVVKQFWRIISGVSSQFSLLGVFVGCIGLYYGFKNHRKFTTFVFIAWLLAGPGFILLANLPFNSEIEGITGRFYVMTNLFWVVFLTFGLYQMFFRRLPVLLNLVLICLMLAISVRVNWSKINWRNHYLSYDYGRNILKTLPHNTILFMDGGDDTFYSLAYLCFAEKRRPDVELHDRGGLVFRNIYGHDFRRLSKEEKEIRRQNIEKTYLLQRPLFYSTFNKDILPGTKLYPNGILYQADNETLNAWYTYSLSRSAYSDYSDYRSRALVPVYMFSRGLALEDPDALAYFEYTYNRWHEVGWLSNNTGIELHKRAYNAFEKNNLKLAKVYYQKIIELKADDVSAITNLGVIAEKENDIRLAKELYEKVIGVNPRYTEAYYNLGVIYWKEEKWEKVVDAFRHVLEINPEHQGAKKYLPQAVYRSEKSH
jgi:tetratricopeptide (TPR) repeat protein